jgi:AcrR family transcriptional regulator
METIAKEAGVTKQTLYARFPNKDHLCNAVIDAAMAQWREQQGPLLDGFTTLEEALYRHSVGTLKTATQGASLLLDRFLHAQSSRDPELAKDVIGPIRAKAIQDIESILLRFSSPERARACDCRVAAEYYFICLSGKIQDLNTFRDERHADSIAAWARTAVRLFIKGYFTA